MNWINHRYQGFGRRSKYIFWLLKYSKPYIFKITLLFLFDVSSSLLGIGLAVISKKIIDSATSGGLMKGTIVLYITIILVSLLISALTNLVSVIINEVYAFGIRKQIYEKIVSSHWMDIMKYHTGDLLTRLTSDAGNVADGIVSVIPSILRLFIELIVTFFTLFYFQPTLAVFALIMAPVVAVVCFLLGRKMKKLQLKVQESESNYRSFIQESLSNLLVVKSFSNEEYAANRLVALRDERMRWIKKRNHINVVSTTLTSLSFQLGYIAAFTFGAVQISKKAITYGTMSVFITLVNRIQAPILQLAQYIPKIISIMASAERIVEIQNINLEEKSEEHIRAENIGVDISDLTFGYDQEAVLDKASISIQPGEFVAIIGRSGIGKTTLIRLIMSFMSNRNGTIEFRNSLGEKEKANAGTREFIAYVPQGNTLFSGTIRENIRMGRLEATEGEIIEALKMAAGYEFVANLPEGLDTVIGERGFGISEGQAQRIAIARALIRKAPFMIFDESTSSLDEKTELEVLKGLQDLKPKPTCLLITHRRSVLQYCDREICIDDKKIVDFC